MASNDPLLRNLDDRKKRRSYAEEHPIASRVPGVLADAGKSYLSRENARARQIGEAVTQFRDRSGDGPLERNHEPIFNPRVPELVQRGVVPYDRQNHAFKRGGPFSAKGEFAELRPKVENPGVQVDDIKPSVNFQRPPNVSAPTGPARGPGAPNLASRAGHAAAAGMLANTTPAPGGAVMQRPYSIGQHGEHVYSDGTGGIARTMSDAQIQGKAPIPSEGGGVTVVPNSAFTRPLLSDVLGHTATPEEGIQLAQRNLQAQQQGPLFARPTPGDYARADAISIANEDPRSAAGIAARNARISAEGAPVGAGSGRDRRRAAQFATGQGTAAHQNFAAAVGAGHAQQAELRQGEENNAAALQRQQVANYGSFRNQQLRGQQEMARQNVADQAAMQRARFNRPAGQQVQLADGSIGLLDPRTGVVTRARDTQGAPVRPANTGKLSPRQKRINDRIDALNKGTQEQLKAITGLGDSATADQIAQIRADQARAQGLEIRTDPKTGRMFTNIDGQVVPL